MFEDRYHRWNERRIKGIVDFYGYKFFYGKKVLDLGCGYADMSGVLHRLGADVLATDARAEHLKIVSKKFPGIKTARKNLDGQWPFMGQKFDLIMDLGVLCHLSSFEAHLKAVCGACNYLVLETAVCDSDSSDVCLSIEEGKGIYDLSFSGMGCRPSPAAIESVLAACGMNFKRVVRGKYNAGNYAYDWAPQNDNSANLEKRALWFASKPDGTGNVEEISEIISTSPFSIAPNRSGIMGAIDSGVPAKMTASPRPPFANRTLTPPVSATIAFPMVMARQNNTAPNLSYNAKDKKFVIVIPSYKNEKWCEKNILSALNREYTNFRIIFTDDCSTDGTFDRVARVVNNSPNGNRVSMIKNEKRMGALANLYNMIHSCRDDEVVLTLDGDDWLANNHVLSKLNSIYSGKVWITYGQYQNSNDKQIGCAQRYPEQVVKNNTFRRHPWGATHLRTFYAWLFKKIKKEDLMKDGVFYRMTWDFAIMFPMLEMAGVHSKFIADILYIYNLENPINDHKVDKGLQQKLDRELRTKPKYRKVEEPIVAKTKVGLLLIATGKYDMFARGIISSADKFFLDSTKDITYFVFSDKEIPIRSGRRVVHVPIEHKSFPFASMDRFKHFTNLAASLSQQDYLYYVDVDCLFVSQVGNEILGDLVGVRHCGFINKRGSYETNPQSCLYVNEQYPKQYKHYYGGGFSGGKSANYLELAKWCGEKIDRDVANNIIPIWHDETALNRYFLDHEPDVILTPSYHYPQSNLPYYKKMWGRQDWKPKIMLLDKNHNEVRR